MKLLVLSVAAAAAFIFTTGCCTSRKPVAWEYRVIQGVTHQPVLEDKLNQAGREGFVIESSTVMPVEPGRLPVTMVILKRPKP
jgi:hypothetical protein